MYRKHAIEICWYLKGYPAVASTHISLQVSIITCTEKLK